MAKSKARKKIGTAAAVRKLSADIESYVIEQGGIPNQLLIEIAVQAKLISDEAYSDYAETRERACHGIAFRERETYLDLLARMGALPSKSKTGEKPQKARSENPFEVDDE